MTLIRLTAITIMSLFVFSCSNKQKKAEKTTAATIVEIPTFDTDSAFIFVKKQVGFGPRVPESKAHARCADYLQREMTRFGATTIVQKATVELYNGNTIAIKNIISSFDPDKKARIMLCAHWDSRPYADASERKNDHNKPILGANDGASGVGILMETARTIAQSTPPRVGIDIIFFDAEDYGTPEFYTGKYKENTWCLGSQHWSRNPHRLDYRARYGILLDMVGDANAVFPKEQISTYFAPQVVEKIWNTANSLGYGKFFVKEQGGAITDDHLYINKLAGIPCVDIIHLDPKSKNGFVNYWHTLDDDLSNISPETLKAVGETLLNVIYNE